MVLYMKKRRLVSYLATFFPLTTRAKLQVTASKVVEPFTNHKIDLH